ncbi:MAG: NADH-quinone oxidoreductase subunit L [Thermoplasmatota archaeon]
MAETTHGSEFHFEQLHGADAWTALLIIGLPIIASALVFFFGKKMWRGGAMIPILAVLGSLGLSLKWFLGMLDHADPAGWTVDWFTIGEYTFTVGVLMDNLSIWMATLVSFLALLIVIFSTKYMSDEPDEKLRRYYAVKALFIGGMLGTVLMDNYLMMFIFWEIMGLCSYLLIGYWFHKESAAIASKKAFLVTRLGDILLMVGLFVLLITFKTLSYREIFNDPHLADHTGSLLAAGLLIFGGAVGKSAQFPLDLWLPDAMEGPTTVSALIHAATMVKAGVYLVARSFPILLENPDTFLVIGIIGGITALYTASMALVALDIKRVLAFSTLSQLGYMFLALGAGGVVYIETHNGVGFTAAMLHLMNHAFFKALLFLGSASVIMGMHHHQDMREMGGLRKKMPITHFTMLVGSLSIAGMIPLSGFWSKDEVLATAFKAGSYSGTFTILWIMGLLTALMTAFYIFRMMFLTFGHKPRTEHAEHAHESPKVMTIPLMILAVFAAISGLWLVTGLGGGFESVITYPYTAELGAAHHVEPSEILSEILGNPLTYLSLAIGATGIFIAWLRYRGGLPAKESEEPTTGLRGLIYNRYYVTQAIYEPLGNILAVGVAKLSNLFDKKGIDGAVNGIANMADKSGQQARRWQNGNVATYTTSIAVGAIVLLALAILLGVL